ncbi:MAG: hypothetical protein HKN48_13085, partial [Flavobacteriaceae bacterium]|nr:hypothetical protein [Flavobacteriaceae bacterium]
MVKVIYIAGDGRSGSTLLDSVLSNIKDSISVGECCRFWVRFNEAESLCGCAEMISDCTLWSEINRRLKSEFPSYDALEFQQKVKEIQFYKNFQNLPKLLDTEEWREFREVVSFFYRSISEVTGKQTIIDSSKSIPWAY